MVFHSARLLSLHREFLLCLSILLRSTLFGDWCTALAHPDTMDQVMQILQQEAIAIMAL